jgi:hypothetical protein
MSERDDNWLQSLERAIEVTEGQLALAAVVSGTKIQLDVEQAQRLIDGIRDLQRRMDQLEQRLK